MHEAPAAENVVPEESLKSDEKAVPVEEPPIAEHTKRKTRSSEKEIEKEVANVAQEMAPAMSQPDKKYVFPPVDLLKAGSSKKSANTESQLRETANKLQQTLKTFGVNVTVTNISCGPAVTRYPCKD